MKNILSSFKRVVVLTIVSIFVAVLIPRPASAFAGWAIMSPADGSHLTNCSFTVTGFLPSGSMGFLFIVDNDDPGQIGPITVTGPKFVKTVNWTDDETEDLTHVTVLLSADPSSSGRGNVMASSGITIGEGGTATGGSVFIDGIYQDAVTSSVRLYWGPNALDAVKPDTFIPSGMVVTILDNDTPGWLHILWAGNDYYIKTGSTMGNSAQISKPYLGGK